MSDIEKKTEQSVDPQQSTEKIGDLPNKEITDQDAEAVKGGLGSKLKDTIKLN